MRRLALPLSSLAFAFALGTFVLGVQVPSAGGKTYSYANRFAPTGTVSVDPERFSTRLAAASANATPIEPSTQSGGCSDNSGTNVREDQECTNQAAPSLLGRSQSQNERSAAVNPKNPLNLVTAQNDYRMGDSGCGVNWTYDGGKHWGSTLLPAKFDHGLVASRHYWDAAGDPSVAFDGSGEAYYTCLVFDRGPTSDTNSNASGFELFRSADGGASWSFPGNYIAVTDGTGNDGIGLLDKPYMAIDTNRYSPFYNRIYVAWIQYNVDFTNGELWFSYSDDHGVTWESSRDIGSASDDLCPVNFDGSTAGTCNLFAFPEPFVAPNGNLYVVADNGNNCNGALGALGFPCSGDPNDNHGQVLMYESQSGGDSFSGPVKVAEYHDLPDCVRYTGEPFSFGTACVPTAPLSTFSVFRAADYPSGVALSNKRIVVSFGSYINRHSNPHLGNCEPAGISKSDFLNRYRGVGEVDGCNNDILESTSSNGGRSFTGTHLSDTKLPSVSRELGAHLADQWWQWTGKSPAGQAVTSYYDRSYGTDEATGRMDITLARDVGTTSRVTDKSMPPSNEFPGVSGYATFLGDYAGLAVGSDGIAHPVWSDTRNPIFTYDETADARDLIFAGYGSDAYTSRVRA